MTGGDPSGGREGYMAAESADVPGPSDSELIQAVRAGRIASFGALYERHVAAAHNLARQLARSAVEADDLVSEAFARVLDVLRAGRGPDSAFRAYLLTTLRHIAYDKTRSERKLELADDVSTVPGADIEKLTRHSPAWNALWPLRRSPGCPSGGRPCCGISRSRVNRPPRSPRCSA
jgi:hypothetical protein